MTKVQAIARVLKDHEGKAGWKVIENEVDAYYPEAKASHYWKEGLRGVVYREIRHGKTFRMDAKGVVALLTV